jgi:hypothetical protein
VRCEERLRASVHQAEIGMSGACGRSFSTKSKSVKNQSPLKPKPSKIKAQQNQQNQSAAKSKSIKNQSPLKSKHV